MTRDGTPVSHNLDQFSNPPQISPSETFPTSTSIPKKPPKQLLFKKTCEKKKSMKFTNSQPTTRLVFHQPKLPNLFVPGTKHCASLEAACHWEVRHHSETRCHRNCVPVFNSLPEMVVHHPLIRPYF